MERKNKMSASFSKVKFMEIRKHFWFNLDETGLLFSEGNLQVIGSKERKKHEKDNQNSRDSITCIRIGSAGGTNGPAIFLSKGKKVDSRPCRNLEKHGAPPGSKVFPTSNAYLNDETWVEIVPHLCKAIRKMPHVRDHPNWWCVITFDGYATHLLPDQLKVFSDHKIMVAKEEGDTSQVCQSYDQYVAKADKREFRALLDAVRPHVHRVLSQWDVIIVMCRALQKVNGQQWVKSFIKVNQHPDHRVSFQEWAAKIDDKLVGDKFFIHRPSLWDAMPSFWKKLTVENRRKLCTLIDEFHRKAEFDECSPWKKENLMLLMTAGVAHSDIIRLRSCYFATKEDCRIFEEEPAAANEAPPEETDPNSIFEGYKLKPTDMVAAMKKTVTKSERAEAGMMLFRHCTRFTALAHDEKTNLAPSAFLDVVVTEDQKTLLNPCIKDLLLGSLMRETSGHHAKKKMSRRRLDYATGFIQSYSRVLNGEANLAKMVEVAQLAASLGEIQADKKEETEQKDAKKNTEAQEKIAKKAEKERRRLERAVELLPTLKEQVEKGLEFCHSLTNAKMVDILAFFFDEATPTLGGKSKAYLKGMLATCVKPLVAPTLTPPHQPE